MRQLEVELASEGMAPADGLPSFLQMGSWIGGDRDGNPFVNESVLRAALHAQSTRIFKYYLDELHRLGGELSLDRRLVGVSAALEELAARSPDRSAYRQDEPYRRAITGIHARLAATARGLDHLDAGQQTVGDAEPYADCAELLGDLGVLRRVTGRQRLGGVWHEGRLKVSCGEPSTVFGFHLADRSICAKTRTCTSAASVRCSSWSQPPALTQLSSNCDEAERTRLLLGQELGSVAPAGFRLS